MDISSLLGNQMLGQAAGQQGLQQGKQHPEDQLMGMVPMMGPLMQAKTALIRQMMPAGPGAVMSGLTNAATQASLMSAMNKRQQPIGGAGVAKPGLTATADEFNPHPERPRIGPGEDDPRTMQDAIRRLYFAKQGPQP